MFNCQCSLLLLTRHAQLLKFNTFSFVCQQLFYFIFSSSFELFTVFATAILDYHIFMILSTTFLIFLNCFLSRCSAHATACLYYHYYMELSTPFFIFYFIFKTRRVLPNTPKVHAFTFPIFSNVYISSDNPLSEQHLTHICKR